MRTGVSTKGLVVPVALALALVGAARAANARAGHGAPQAAVVASDEAPLSNADVVKLSKLGLGDDLVLAKINQARKVDFALDTDSLVKLKEQGVSGSVIQAMLKRASPPLPEPLPAPSTVAAGGAAATEEGVWLRTSQDEVRLESVQGDFSTTYAVVTVLMFLDFPGLQAELRINDPRPALSVRISKNPRGRVFLVKCESNKKDNNRSVKVGKSSPFGMKSWSSPDGDWTIEFESREVAPGQWELKPKQDLPKGEYGLLFRGGFAGTLGAERAELYDFGVD